MYYNRLEKNLIYLLDSTKCRLQADGRPLFSGYNNGTIVVSFSFAWWKQWSAAAFFWSKNNGGGGPAPPPRAPPLDPPLHPIMLRPFAQGFTDSLKGINRLSRGGPE